MPTSLMRSENDLSVRSPDGRLAIGIVGMSLCTFFIITFAVCVAGYILLPSIPITHAALSLFLPNFSGLDWRSIFIGLAASVFWGWYIAVLFCPLYNIFSRQGRQ